MGDILDLDSDTSTIYFTPFKNDKCKVRIKDWLNDAEIIIDKDQAQQIVTHLQEQFNLKTT